MNEAEEKSPEKIAAKISDKSFIMAKATTIAMFIVLLTLGVIFIILTLIKFLK
jgi:hypothetical protein